MRDKLDAETIAKGLSEGQRRWLRVNEPAGKSWLSFSGKNFMVTQRQLQKRGLVGQCTLTPLGLAVRAILRGE